MNAPSETYDAVILMAGIAPITTQWPTYQQARHHAAAAVADLARSPELALSASVLIVDNITDRTVDEYHGPSIFAVAQMMAKTDVPADVRIVDTSTHRSTDQHADKMGERDV